MCSSPGQNPSYYTHDLNGSDLDNTHQRFTYNSAGQPATVALATQLFAPRQLKYRGAGQSELVKDGSFTLQHNQLGIGTRGASHYARATDGTLTSERLPPGSGRRNYIYDGEGTVVGLTDATDGTGTLETSYTYDPDGHPPNMTSLGDPNPFGYQGAYAAGLETDGTLCGGPTGGRGGAFYDPEDGRPTQPVVGLPPGVVPLVSISDLPSPGDIADKLNDAARKLQDVVNGGAKLLRSGAGRCTVGGALVGGGVFALTRSPSAGFTTAERAKAVFLAAGFGCGGGLARKIE